MKKHFKWIALILAVILTVSLAGGISAEAARKPRLNKKKITVRVGKTFKLKVKNNKKKVKWKTSNKKIATVSKKGRVKGKKPGRAVITAKVGKKKLKCRVIVKRKKKTTKTPAKNPVTAKPTTATTTTVKPTVRPTTAGPQTTKPVETSQQPTKPEPTTLQSTNPQTTAPEVTQPQPTTTDDGKPAPKEVFGQNILSEKGLQVSFTWGSDAEIESSGQTFNVYYDGILGESGVHAGVITHTFTTAGKHTITIKGYLNGKESNGVELTVDLQQRDPEQGTYWVAIPGDPANTYYYDDDTSVSVVSIQKPEFAAETGIYMSVSAGISSVDVNGKNTGFDIQGAGVLVHLSALTEELNTIQITHGLGTDTVVIKNSTKSIEQTTIPSVTEPQSTPPQSTSDQSSKPSETTQKPTNPQVTQPAIDFVTDSSITKPFGMVLSEAGTGYVSVVWGRGDIDCYNIYVDGERRRTGVTCAKYTLPVYFEGTHTVAVTTVVGTRESEKEEMTIAITGVGEKETEPETCPEELKPQLKEDVELKSDRITIELNNKTNGEYSDNEIYWCIVGNNSSDELCYLDKDGNMVRASETLNTVSVNGGKYADIYHTLAEADYVYAPTIRSGRMYISYGKPVYLKFVGSTGYAGPDLNNPSDVNAGTLYEFAEFTIEGKSYWGNTTRVDYFCFPMITRLVGNTLYGGYDKVVGDIGTREEIFNAFRNEAPAEFKTLVKEDRIMAPCKATFNTGQPYGNYFDDYINEFWTKYTKEDLKFSIEAGSFTGRVVGDRMQFTKAGDSQIYYVDKPTTQEVLEGKGAFDRGNEVEKAIEAQLCAAFNRGVATEPDKYYKVSEYYKNTPNNFYAGFFHRHSVLGLAYGFCYDDVNDQSTLLQYDKSDALIIDLRW